MMGHSALYRLMRSVRNLARYKTPEHLRSRFGALSVEGRERIAAALREHVFAEDWLSSPAGAEDFQNHLLGRLDADRQQVAPWLDSIQPLAGMRLLEIGCGTGSSTVALCEQGADVIALDLDEPAMAVAGERLAAYGQTARLVVGNAVDAERLFAGERLDGVLFYASLEHMTHTERLAAMQGAWRLLPPGGLWCVVEAPNRLWYYDHHTSHLNFFQWLPDDLARAYASFSPRQDFRERFTGGSPPNELEFLRLGRGVSYHEFELALGPSEGWNVASSLGVFQRQHDPWLWLRWRFSGDGRYERFLTRLRPDLHSGFFEPQLNLALRKG